MTAGRFGTLLNDDVLCHTTARFLLISEQAETTDDASSFRINEIFAALPAADLAALSEHLRIVSLSRGQITNHVDQPIHHVDFPLDAMISVMATFANGTTCELAFVGREGFVEADAALAGDVALRTTICQIPGTVARIRLDAFREALETMPPFRRIVQRSLRSRLNITEQISSCNLKHTVTDRFARWLLTTSDQLQRDRINLTQESFAVMLGVRRAGVSESAAALQRLGAIRVERAAITIVDRAALAGATCECYDAIRTAMERTFEPVGADG